jgi:predicted  nucleic acid-binding Zn-ribbon protein
MHSLTLSRAVIGATLLIAIAGHAADKPKEASFGGGKGSGAFLTRNQLRDCMAQQAKVKQTQADMVALQDKLAADKAEIGKTGETLKADLEALDRTNPEAVSAYNERAVARDKRIDEYQQQVDQFNARVDPVRAERDAFSKACENRRYFEDDEIAIRKGK